LFGLEILMASWLTLTPATTPVPVLAEVECKTKFQPKVKILPSKSRVKYDFTKTKAQLNNVDVDTVSPYGPSHKTQVSGLMSGSIQVKHETSFMHESYEQLGRGCLYLKQIDVTVHIDPTIYIASEFPKGSCMHSAVLAHEYKHVRVDQLIVNKYSRIIGDAMKRFINQSGTSYGPFESERLPHVQNNIQNSLNKVLRDYSDRMNNERRKKQQAIDSYEEYESIGKRCPNHKH